MGFATLTCILSRMSGASRAFLLFPGEKLISLYIYIYIYVFDKYYMCSSDMTVDKPACSIEILPINKELLDK